MDKILKPIPILFCIIAVLIVINIIKTQTIKLLKQDLKEDIEFLKSQGEDIVRYEDLDEEGKKIWNKLRSIK